MLNVVNADSYHGEGLDVLVRFRCFWQSYPLLIYLWTRFNRFMLTLIIWVVNHNRHLHWSLSDTQLQAYLIRIFKEYRRRIHFCVA